jgi:DNA-directed RNA polymerase subunit RPC12/RpoP
MPPVHRDGPQVGTEGHPDASNAITTLKITRSPAGGRRQRAPIAPASVFGPVGRRRFWWYTYRCKTCGAHLFGRAKSLDAVTGERRAGCGHRGMVMAARIYSQPEPGVAA